MEKRQFYVTGVLLRFIQEQNSETLIRTILALQDQEIVKREEFQVWRLKRKHKSKFYLILDDGNYNKILRVRVVLPHCKANKLKLYFENSVLCFPKER